MGARGERAAKRYLSRQNYRLLARNYRCPAGEIDLICSQGPAIVFVEVKTRTSDHVQDPLEAIRPTQWRRIENAAHYFLMRQDLVGRACRFDVVTVVWPDRGSPRIEHFANAYQARRK